MCVLAAGGLAAFAQVCGAVEVVLKKVRVNFVGYGNGTWARAGEVWRGAERRYTKGVQYVWRIRGAVHLADQENLSSVFLPPLNPQTGIRPKDIDILITTCSIYCPTPSMASMVVNAFGMRKDIQVGWCELTVWVNGVG